MHSVLWNNANAMHLFDVLEDPTDPNLFYYYEVFVDAEAYAAHGKRPHGPVYQEQMRSVQTDRDRVHHVANSLYSADPAWTHSPLS